MKDNSVLLKSIQKEKIDVDFYEPNGINYGYCKEAVKRISNADSNNIIENFKFARK